MVQIANRLKVLGHSSFILYQNQQTVTINSMIQTQKQQDPPEAEIIQQKKQSLHPTLQKSDHLEDYTQSFKNIKQQCELYCPNFEQHNIEYHEDRFCPFSYSIVEKINSSEILILKVDIGSFRLHLKIYNSPRNSPLSRKIMTSEGNNGKVYTFQFLSQRIAVKSYQISSHNSPYKVSVLSKAIEEYCITKICHALQCGPYCPSYFGFDILVFNDRIEFAMEECEKVRNPQLCFQGMLQLLGIMHRFKIMHMDINCSNIMYSPVRGKNIFIDFGYSSVISQDCGYKSLTSYKGTFQFVSGQMLSLFSLDINKGMIDLYFNDLVCLQTARKLFTRDYQNRKETTPQRQKAENDSESESIDGCSDMFEGYASIDERGNQQEYLLIILKHSAYFNKLHVKQLLGQYPMLLIEQNGRRILQIFIEMLPSTFFEDLVFNDLKQLSKLDQYQQFSQISRIKKQKQLSYTTKTIDQNPISSNSYLGRFFLQNSQGHSQASFKEEPIDFLIRQLQDKSDSILAQIDFNYYQMILNCLRFDRKNFHLAKKKRLASAFVRFVQNGNVTQNPEPLFEIRMTFDYLLSYCLRLPLNQQKNRLRFELMVEAIMVDLQLSPHLLELQRHIGNKVFGLMELLQMLYEYYLMEGLYEMKNKLVNSIQTFDMIQKISKQILLLKSMMAEAGTIDSCCQHYKISNIMAHIIASQATKESFYYKLLPQVDSIQDKTARAIFYKIIFIVELKHAKYLNDFQLYYKLISIIKTMFSEQVKLVQDNFIENLFWNIVILDYGYFSTQYDSFRSKVKSTLNCEPIYKTFYFRFCQRDQLSTAKAIYQPSMLHQIIQGCLYHGQIDYFSRQIHYIFTILRNRLELRQSNIDIIQKMAEISLRFVQHALQQYFATPAQSLCSVESKTKQDNHHQQDRLRIDKNNRAINFLSFQTQLYFFFVNLGKHTEKYKRQYQEVIKKYYWKYLEAKALVPQTGQQYCKCMVIYYNMVRVEADYNGDLLELVRLGRQMVPLVYGLIFPSYLTKAALMHIVQLNKVIQLKYLQLEQRSDSCNLFIINVLIWAWKYYKQQNYMDAYLHDLYNYEHFIGDTLAVLQPTNFWKILSEHSVDSLSKQPVFSFMINMTSLDQYLPQLLIYSALKAKFGQIDRSNAYLIYCYGLCLRKCDDIQIMQILKEIRNAIRLVNWMCKEHLLSFYYEHVIAMRLYGTSAKRKFMTIFSIISTKLAITNEEFQNGQLRKYLRQLGINKTKNPFKILLRNKITRKLKNKIDGIDN